MEVSGLYTLLQCTQEESCLPGQTFGDRQIFIWAVEPAEPAGLPGSLLGLSGKNWVSAELGRQSPTRENLQETSLLKGKSNTILGIK